MWEDNNIEGLSSSARSAQHKTIVLNSSVLPQPSRKIMGWKPSQWAFGAKMTTCRLNTTSFYAMWPLG